MLLIWIEFQILLWYLGYRSPSVWCQRSFRLILSVDMPKSSFTMSSDLQLCAWCRWSTFAVPRKKSADRPQKMGAIKDEPKKGATDSSYEDQMTEAPLDEDQIVKDNPRIWWLKNQNERIWWSICLLKNLWSKICQSSPTTSFIRRFRRSKSNIASTTFMTRM